jgi:hypothetical protein
MQHIGSLISVWSKNKKRRNKSQRNGFRHLVAECLEDRRLLAADTTPPVTTAPPDVTLEAPADISPAHTGTATVTDDTDPGPTATFSDILIPTACAQEFTILRIWTGTDESENISTDLQVIHVVDTTPPVISAPSDVTLEIGDSTDPASTGVALATDTADPAPTITFADRITPGTSPEESTITRTWTATDDCGNTGTADQLILVGDSDTTAPEVSIDSATDGDGVVVAEGGSTFSDSIKFEFSSNEVSGVTFESNLDGTEFVASVSPQEYVELSVGSHTYEVRATDAAGNASQVSASFSWSVLTPVQAIGDLVDKVTALHLPKGTEKGLLTKLDGSIKKLEDGNLNNDKAAIGKLQAFITEVEAFRGKQLSDEQVDSLIAAASDVIDEINDQMGTESIDEVLLSLLANRD